MTPLRRTALRLLLAAAGLAATAGSLPAGETVAGGTLPAEEAGTGADVITVYLVRHAEKAADDPRDPELTAAGRQRAARLAFILQDEPVTHLFSTPLQRTLQTLAPLAEERGLEIVTTMDMREQADRLLSLPPGATAVLAGHSNTVPALVAALGGEVSDTIEGKGGPQLHDDSHDRLFVAVLAPGADGAPARLLRLQQLRYGAP